MAYRCIYRRELLLEIAGPCAFAFIRGQDGKAACLVWEPKGLQAVPAWPQGSWGGEAGDGGQAGWEFAVIIHMAWSPATRSGLVGGLHSSPTFASNEQQAFVPTSDRVEQIVKGLCSVGGLQGRRGQAGATCRLGRGNRCTRSRF